MLDVRRVISGIDALSRVLQSLGERAPETAEAHVIGHSVGGAVVLTYLAALRAQVHSPPPVRLRVALSLDAAVAGLAGLWSGAKSYLLDLADDGLHGLHDWAEDQGIAMLTASNEGDVWSHRRLGDLPYLGARFGSRLALRDQCNGSIHDWLRRTPEFVQAVWGTLESPLDLPEVR
jgi:pimeloyl-ACP methyl ester carboxylesterase